MQVKYDRSAAVLQPDLTPLRDASYSKMTVMPESSLSKRFCKNILEKVKHAWKAFLRFIFSFCTQAPLNFQRNSSSKDLSSSRNFTKIPKQSENFKSKTPSSSAQGAIVVNIHICPPDNDLSLNTAPSFTAKNANKIRVACRSHKLSLEEERNLHLGHLQNHTLFIDPFVVGTAGGIRATAIHDPKARTSSLEEVKQISLPLDKQQILSHLRVTVRANVQEAETPYYVSSIVNGNAEHLLRDADKNTFENWAKGELHFLGECPCHALSRTKNPEFRRDFDDLVLAYVGPDMLMSKGRYCMTYFATGYLFSSFVQAVQILSYLKEKKWKGRLIWNVIDTIYESSVQSKFADQSLHTKSILCFKEQIARILPQEIAFELNVFSSHSEYIVAANEDEALKFNCIVGMDPGDADYIWRKRDLSLAGYLDAFEFLLYKPEEIPHHILGQVKDRDHLDYQAK